MRQIIKNAMIKIGIDQGTGTNTVNKRVITKINQWIKKFNSFLFLLTYLIDISISKIIITGITAA